MELFQGKITQKACTAIFSCCAMKDVEILPDTGFFTCIQKHTVYFHLEIYRSL